MAEERLQKILAQANFGSRRAAEELIVQGRVKVNGQVAILGSKADVLRDTITVDGKPLPRLQTDKIYIALNKPRGVISDNDPSQPRPSILDLVPPLGHLFAVGRLDMDSEGLMLLTNDGDLANRLTHPRYGHEKEYRVQVGKQPDDSQLAALRHGVVLEDGRRTAPAQVILEGQAGKGFGLRIILKEGRKRQIREMGKTIGLPVLRILRVRIGPLELGDLKPGKWRYLTNQEIAGLVGSVGSKSAPKPRPAQKVRGVNRNPRGPKKN